MSTTQIISVIIPCYKQSHFLTACIASIQAQTYPHWEAIIVNDGSPDNTAEIAASLISVDARIKYIEKKNGGLSSARNAGLSVATGDYIQFLDADDLLLPEKFSVHMNGIGDLPINSINYTDYFHGDCESPLKRVNVDRLSCELICKRPVEDFSSRWEFEFSIPIHTALIPAWLFRNKGIRFNESLANHEDWYFWMNISSYVEKFVFTPKELCIYRYCPESMSRNHNLMFNHFNKAIETQLQLYKEDLRVVNLLRYLSSRNKFHHRRDLKGKCFKVTQFSLFKKIPWSIQKLIFNYFNTPPTNKFR